MAVKVKQASSSQETALITKKTPEAYQLWMYLMQNPEELYVKT